MALESTFPGGILINQEDLIAAVIAACLVALLSLFFQKTVSKHVRFTGQIANDHYRPGLFEGYADSNPPHRNAVLVTPKDWYLSTKLAYFF